MIYFYHHYELPVIQQQAEIRDLLFRNNQPNAGSLRQAGTAGSLRQAVLHRNLTTAMAANNNNNVNVANNNIVRPRIRGFSIGGIRFRFVMVF